MPAQFSPCSLQASDSHPVCLLFARTWIETALATQICHFRPVARGTLAKGDCSGRHKEVKQEERKPEEAEACAPVSCNSK